jgi:hypothetical protein
MITTAVTARSAPLVTESSTTHRSTAAADSTLAGVLSNGPHHEDSTGAPILREPPANGCPAIPTRVHHRGGSPIHRAPTRRRAQPRSPPSPPRVSSSSLHPGVNTVRPRPHGLRALRVDPGAPSTAQPHTHKRRTSGSTRPKRPPRTRLSTIDKPFHINAGSMTARAGTRRSLCALDLAANRRGGGAPRGWSP